MFDDLLDANRAYQDHFQDSGKAGVAARGLAVVTCIDSRIDPLALLGLVPGDAKIIRNAGARVTNDVLRSLILATHLLGVHRICVMQHTECAMVGSTDEDLRRRISAAGGVDVSDWDFMSSLDQAATLRSDLDIIRACPALSPDLTLGGFIVDVRTGALKALEP
ncbi:MAG: beta-class carbonic anhydrase [Candidatus Dormibacteria bacterium]